MGFGFNLLLAFLILPTTGLLLLVWIISRKRFVLLIVLTIWGGIISLVLLSLALRPFFQKVELEPNDYHGDYIVDRSYFPGKQADWQYNRFRFTITEEDSIYFYVTDQEKILQTFRGTTSYPTPYSSARLAINMEGPEFHVLSSNPTIHREVWSFYLTLYSPKYNNLFFRKGTWKPID